MRDHTELVNEIGRSDCVCLGHEPKVFTVLCIAQMLFNENVKAISRSLIYQLCLKKLFVSVQSVTLFLEVLRWRLSFQFNKMTLMILSKKKHMLLQ
jgi:hypothetical protein